MISADGHLLRRIDERVVHAQIGQCHQYFTVINERVTTCDGAGWVHAPGPSWVSDRVIGAIERMLQ